MSLGIDVSTFGVVSGPQSSDQVMPCHAMPCRAATAAEGPVFPSFVSLSSVFWSLASSSRWPLRLYTTTDPWCVDGAVRTHFAQHIRQLRDEIKSILPVSLETDRPAQHCCQTRVDRDEARAQEKARVVRRRFRPELEYLGHTQDSIHPDSVPVVARVQSLHPNHPTRVNWRRVKTTTP